MMTGWFAALGAAAQLPDPMAATSKWLVSSSETACHLVREFADKEATNRLDISLVPTKSSYAILETLSGSSVPTHSRNRADAIITSSPAGKIVRTKYQTIMSDKSTTVSLMFVDKADLDQIGTADTLRISANGSRELSTKSFGGALKALNKCGDDLLAQWRASVTADMPGVIAAEKPNFVPQAFGPNSYPADALRRKAEGVSVAMFSIDTTGRATQCAIVHSAGDAALDRATCGAMRRAGSGVYPAQDAQGTPIPSTFILPVLWTSPKHAAVATTINPGSIIVTSR
jgi:TonB family protein